MTSYTLPNNVSKWPYTRNLNSHYEVALESSQWAESFNAFDAKAQRAFNRCDVGKLALLAYPMFDRARARTGCDLANLLFIIDEHSDVESEEGVRQMAVIVNDALHNPHKPRPDGEWVGGEATRQFWERALKVSTPTAQGRIIKSFNASMDAVVQEAEDRNEHLIRTIDSYVEVRRGTIASRPAFAIFELELDIPDEVYHHPTLESLRLGAIDMICIGNDIYSYNVEQARGDDLHNLVTCVMHQLDLDLQSAMDYIGLRHDRLAAAFLLAKDSLPSFGEDIDAQVAGYVYALGNAVRANDSWSFESQRYFGKEGLEIMEHRTVTLLPKKDTVGSKN